LVKEEEKAEQIQTSLVSESEAEDDQDQESSDSEGKPKEKSYFKLPPIAPETITKPQLNEPESESDDN
jgi:hypothetical protein